MCVHAGMAGIAPMNRVLYDSLCRRSTCMDLIVLSLV